MQLSAFILAHQETIAQEWIAHARTLKPEHVSLRDHIDPILHAIAADLETDQTEAQRLSKAQGQSDGNDSLGASHLHAIERAMQRFSIEQLAAEFRALRASILRLWFAHEGQNPGLESIEQIVRFNESIDQILAESIGRFARDVQESRDLFLAVLSHDLRNPLSAIQNFAKVIRQTPALPPEKAWMVADRIISGVDRVMGMVNDLLDVARVRFGHQMPIARAPMALDKLCDDLTTESRMADPAATIELRTAGNLSGNWDRVRLGQVISNLLSNALNHGDTAKPIVLTAQGQDDEVVLTVHNHGSPIAERMKPSIFKAFVRSVEVDAKLKPSQGLGLGLYIACQIVIAHGGTIGFDSSEEAGTTFTVRLPRSEGLS